MHRNLIVKVVILCTYFLNSVPGFDTDEDTWEEFLLERKQYADEELKDNTPEVPKTIVELKEVLTHHTQIPLSKNYKSGHLFELFNTTYLFLDKELYNLTIGNNTHLTKSDLQFSRVFDNISMILTREYQDSGFVVIGYYSGNCDMFGLFSGSFKFIQTIQLKGYPTDGKFFVNNGKLYFIVASILQHKYSPTFYYAWSGSHFDRSLQPIIGGFGTNKLLTFPKNETGEIIIATENYIDFPNLRSHILEFENGKIKEAQRLPVHQFPLFLLTFVENGDRFLLLFQVGHISLFYYDGNHFHKTNSFETVSGIQKVSLAYVKDIPLILVATKEKLIIYKTKDSDNLRIMTSIRYDKSFKSVVDIAVKSNQTEDYIVLSAINQNNQAEVHVLYIRLIFFNEGKEAEKVELLDCLIKLKSYLTNDMSDLKKRDVANNVADSFQNNQLPIDFGFDLINKTTTDLIDKVLVLQPVVDEMYNKRNQVIFGNLVIDGNLIVEVLESSNFNVSTINEKLWHPNRWLSYSKQQIITGSYIFNELNVKNLATGKDNLLNNMLLVNGKQNLYGDITIETLKANQTYLSEINGIPFSNIYLRSNPLKIMGKKIYRNLQADRITVNTVNGQSQNDLLNLLENNNNQTKYNFRIKNLMVESINDVQWDEFKNNVFRIGLTSTITGNLSMKSLITEKLDTSALAGRNASDLFTTSTPQVIESSIVFSNIYASNITANKVNKIDMDLEVISYSWKALNEIKTPISIKNMKVYGNLHIESSTDSLTNNKPETIQIYNKVKINGDLILKDLNQHPNVTIIINNNAFSVDSLNQYWTKRTQQIIPSRVEATSGITIPHLLTVGINGVSLDQYMLNNDQDKLNRNFYFENVHIIGNLTMNDYEILKPDLRKLNIEAVRLNGSYVINGKKTYQGQLVIDNLNTKSINGLFPKNMISANLNETSGNQYFETLIINGNVSTSQLTLQNLNAENILELYEKTVFIDVPQKINKLRMDRVYVKDMYLTIVNGANFDNYMESLDNAFGVTSIKGTTVIGDVYVKSITGVSAINLVDVETLLNGDNFDRKRFVQFTGPVRVNDLQANYINNVNFKELHSTIFYRNYIQNITGVHSFKELRTRNLAAPQINDKKIGNLINIRYPKPKQLYVDNVKVYNSNFLKSVFANQTTCDINKALAKLKNPDTRTWKSMNVLKNMELWDEESGLFQLMNYSVLMNKHNIIRGQVTFKNLYGRDVTTKDDLNGVNINYIAEDALYKKRNNQTVNGKKEFRILRGIHAYSGQNINVPVVNKISVQKLNETIIYKNNVNNVVIRGTKKFVAGLKTTNLHTEFLSGIPVSDIVSFDDAKQIPKVSFDKLIISDNLKVNYVANNDFNEFLSRRVLKHADAPQELLGVYIFNNMILNGSLILTSINDIPFDDIVFDEGSQIVNSQKVFAEDVYIPGNAQIEQINELDLSKIYEESVMMDDNLFINNMVINADAKIASDISAQNVNRIPITEIKQSLNNTQSQAKTELTENTIKNIGELLKQNFRTLDDLPQKYLYIDYLHAFDISLKNIINTQVIDINGETMMHIISEETNTHCNLPPSCKCPVQHTLQITSEYSISAIENKESQRVYSYNDKQISIYVITNSISSSEVCRTNLSKAGENTTIIFNSIVAQGNSWLHEGITGYISDVKFFTLKNYTYAVIGRYYDKANNTHHVDSLLIRFSKDMDRIEDIKPIPTCGAWSLTILYTYEGVNLVIANNVNNPRYNSDSDVLIFRFDESRLNFDLLRRVPVTKCVSVTGIVLESESFVVLAEENHKVHVLKYNPVNSNYYMYQTFLLDSLVISLSSFNLDAKAGEPYLCIVTESSHFYLYSFQFLEGWKLMSHGVMEGLHSLIPFALNKQNYLFAPASNTSRLLNVVKQG